MACDQLAVRAGAASTVHWAAFGAGEYIVAEASTIQGPGIPWNRLYPHEVLLLDPCGVTLTIADKENA